MKLLCHNQKCKQVFNITDYYCLTCLDYMCSQKCFEEHYCNGFSEKEIQEIGRYYIFNSREEEEK